MNIHAPIGDTSEAEKVNAWLENFQNALSSTDKDSICSLFHDTSHWRDLAAFHWDIRTIDGAETISSALSQAKGNIKPHNFRIPADRTPPRRVTRAGTPCIEAIFAFETKHGHASGVVRLTGDDPRAPKAWMLATTLEDLSAHGITEGSQVASDAFSRDFGGENWLDKRQRHQEYRDREPAVLVIGAGQAGLGIAARLTAIGIDTLVVDRVNRIGDNWRNRYHSLTLHNEAHVNHMPFIPFPKTFPVFIPKDKLANWFEFYADAMDLNVWTSTALEAGSYDEQTGRWSIELSKSDGTTRSVKPHHLVFATGVSSIPVTPEMPGLSDFAGTVMHSGYYTEGSAWTGKRALVIGTGNSAHDVAQDLHASGVQVTMMQRSSTYIVSLKEAQKVYALYDEGPCVDDCDLLASATAYDYLVPAHQMATASMKEVDARLLDALAAKGFRLNDGEPDATGFQMKYLRRGGGYYFNVGCSDLIADGAIDLIHHADFDTFTEDGARMKNGTDQPFDLIVTATGYLNQQDVVRRYLGDEIADRIGPVWGFDDGGELANMWKPTPQHGLWFTAGSLAQCRIYSKPLAFQIAASVLGLTNPS